MRRWMGVDVGGKRKAFDVALVDDTRLIDARRRQSVDDIVASVAAAKPSVVAIDSPRSAALAGQKHRPEEKELRDAVCGIRWTPSTEQLGRNPYYEWIVEGLRLYETLQEYPVQVIECFQQRHGRAGVVRAMVAGVLPGPGKR